MKFTKILLIGVILALVTHMSSIAGEDMSNPGKIPRLGDFTTPVLSPGESGDLNFTITNRYSGKILNLTLGLEIYKYATLRESRMIDSTFSDPPTLTYLGREYGTKLVPEVLLGALSSGTKLGVVFTIHTKKSTPHGSVFDNAAYFVRISIRFEYTEGNQTSSYKMMSRGYFSDSDWENATRGGGLNLTYLKTRYGVDAIIPETSFTVREPVPAWPLYLLIFLAGLFGVLAIIFYLHETHGYFPSLDKRLKEWSGKLRKVRRLPEKGKNKS